MRKLRIYPMLLLPLAVSSMAWESLSTKLEFTRVQLDGLLRLASDSTHEGYTPSLPRAVVQVYQALPEAEKTAAVRELIAAARPIVLSPAFLASKDEQIQRVYGGVNHGLRVISGEEMTQLVSSGKMTHDQYMKQSKLRAAGNNAMDAYRFELRSIRSSLEGDIRSAEYMANHMQPMPGMPDQKKVLELARAAAAIPDSNETAFRRAYAALKSIQAGGPTDDATVDKLVKEAQQEVYDQHCAKTLLRRGLEGFLKNAAAVNFAASTTQKGNRTVFTDSRMENANSQVKFLYRLGRGPTAAAVEAAKAILKEL
jgi:hypothetical protein